MTPAANEILLAGINDAQAAVAAIQQFETFWKTFAQACQDRNMDAAHTHGERLVTLVESAVDLYLSSVRRMSQFERLVQERDG